MQFPFSTGWHCAHCDIDITPPSPGLFSFNHPLGACPHLPRLRPHHRDRSGARDPRSRAEHRAGCGEAVPDRERAGMPARSAARRGRRGSSICMCPFEELPAADQDWVLYGEQTGANDEELSEDRAVVWRARASSTGSNRRATRCTSACCSAAIATTRTARIAAAAAISRRR